MEPNTVKSPLSDAELEHYIDVACVLINRAPDFTSQRIAAQAMARLISMRSPQRVRQMEAARGLSR